MGGEGWLFLFAVLAAAGLLFSMVFYIILFSDLECDYVSRAWVRHKTWCADLSEDQPYRFMQQAQSGKHLQ